MSALLLQHSEWLSGVLWLVALVAGLLFAMRLRAQRRRRRLLGPRAEGRALGGASDLALVCVLGLIGIALLGPRLGQRDIWLSTAGSDVVITLDVSRSMDAQDVPPSRLTRARATALELLAGLASGDRAALAVFAGQGALLTPLTHDHDALAQMIPLLDTRLLPTGGTHLAAGLEAATSAFEDAHSRPRLVVVLSDGEVNAEDRSASTPPSAVSLDRSSARLIAVALGTPTGATVPDRGGPLRDETNRIVISRRHLSRLAGPTESSGGVLFLADEWGAVNVDALLAEIDRDRLPSPASAGTHVLRRQKAALVAPFAALAAALLILDTLLSLRSDARRSRGPLRFGAPLSTHTRLAARWLATRARGLRAIAGAGGALPLLILLLGASLPVLLAAQVNPNDRAHFEKKRKTADSSGRRQLEVGLAQAQSQRFRLAEKSFQSAAILGEDSAMRALAYYNLGVLALQRGRLADARELYQRSLAIAPGERKTRFNLEWTILEIQMLEKNAEGPPKLSWPESENGDHRPEEVPQDRDGPTTLGNETSSDAAEAPHERPGDSRSASTRQAGGGPTQERLTPLTEQERAGWLDRVEDDPGRAIRATTEQAARGLADRSPPGAASW